MPLELPPVVILCGGRGSRLQEHAGSLPKPLVEVGGRPILWHVIHLYLAHGFRRFLLLTGYRAEQVHAFAGGAGWPSQVRVDCLDTGVDTPTGGRLHRAAEAIPDERFCLAYADGVADIQLDALLEYHRAHGRQATMAVVQPRLPFGVARLDGNGSVVGFAEKPRSELWVNAGFFCFERSALAVVEAESVLEREPLERLAAARHLRAYRHEGFWECMDTHKDWVTLNDLWASGRAPWRWGAETVSGGGSARRARMPGGTGVAATARSASVPRPSGLPRHRPEDAPRSGAPN